LILQLSGPVLILQLSGLAAILQLSGPAMILEAQSPALVGGTSYHIVLPCNVLDVRIELSNVAQLTSLPGSPGIRSPGQGVGERFVICEHREAAPL